MPLKRGGIMNQEKLVLYLKIHQQEIEKLINEYSFLSNVNVTEKIVNNEKMRLKLRNIK